SDGSVLEWRLREGPRGPERIPGIAPRDVTAEITRQRVWNLSGLLQVLQSYGKVIVGSPSTGPLLHTISPPNGGQSRVALSPDQRWVAEAPELAGPRLGGTPRVRAR